MSECVPSYSLNRSFRSFDDSEFTCTRYMFRVSCFMFRDFRVMWRFGTMMVVVMAQRIFVVLARKILCQDPGLVAAKLADNNLRYDIFKSPGADKCKLYRYGHVSIFVTSRMSRFFQDCSKPPSLLVENTSTLWCRTTRLLTKVGCNLSFRVHGARLSKVLRGHYYHGQNIYIYIQNMKFQGIKHRRKNENKIYIFSKYTWTIQFLYF